MAEAVNETRGRPAKAERNGLLLAYYRAGHTVRETAKVFEISPQRVGQLVRGIRSTAETWRLKTTSSDTP